MEDPVVPYRHADAMNDVAFIVAQMTAGVKGALPEQDDYEIAEEVVNITNEKIEEFYNV